MPLHPRAKRRLNVELESIDGKRRPCRRIGCRRYQCGRRYHAGATAARGREARQLVEEWKRTPRLRSTVWGEKITSAVPPELNFQSSGPCALKNMFRIPWMKTPAAHVGLVVSPWR